MADTVETGWSLKGNQGEGTNTEGQGEGCTTSMLVSRKRRDQVVGWGLVGLGDHGNQMSVLNSLFLLCVSGLSLSQGPSWGFPLTIKQGGSSECRTNVDLRARQTPQP